MFVRLVAAGLSLLGAALILFGIYFLFLGNEARRWPSVEGRIVATRIRVDTMVAHAATTRSQREREREYYPEVEYAWQVDGRPYSGTRYQLGTTHPKFDTREEAREAGRAFAAGSPIAVYYDPDHPDSAVLDPSADIAALIAPSALGLLFLVTGALLWFRAPAVEAASRAKAAASHAAAPRSQ